MAKKIFDKTMLKFALVGLINTLVGAAIMFLCYNLLNLSYWFSSAANYVVGSTISFFLNKYYTFKVKKHDIKYVVKFIVNIAVCYLVAYGIAKPLTLRVLSGASLSVQENVAMVVGMGLFVVLNYFGQRFFAFKDAE